MRSLRSTSVLDPPLSPALAEIRDRVLGLWRERDALPKPVGERVASRGLAHQHLVQRIRAASDRFMTQLAMERSTETPDRPVTRVRALDDRAS